MSSTPEQISRADKLQNFSGRARMASMLWTFKVDQADGVSCPGGGTAPSTETYAFDDETITGTHTSLHGRRLRHGVGDEQATVLAADGRAPAQPDPALSVAVQRHCDVLLSVA